MIRKIIKYILLNLINTKNKTAINYNIIEERFIQSLRIRDNDVIFDVGCHNGETIERLLRVNKRLKIHSFEPDYDCFKKILNKYKENKNIIINNLALGKKKKKENSI